MIYAIPPEIPPYKHTTYNVHMIDGKIYTLDKKEIQEFNDILEKQKFFCFNDHIIFIDHIVRIEPTPESKEDKSWRKKQYENRNYVIRANHEDDNHDYDTCPICIDGHKRILRGFKEAIAEEEAEEEAEAQYEAGLQAKAD